MPISTSRISEHLAALPSGNECKLRDYNRVIFKDTGAPGPEQIEHM